jgi:hypothetical protein
MLERLSGVTQVVLPARTDTTQELAWKTVIYDTLGIKRFHLIPGENSIATRVVGKGAVDPKSRSLTVVRPAH